MSVYAVYNPLLLKRVTPTLQVELVKGASCWYHYLEMQVQQRIQKHPNNVKLSAKGRLNLLNDRDLSLPPKLSCLPTTITSILSGFSFSSFTYLQPGTGKLLEMRGP